MDKKFSIEQLRELLEQYSEQEKVTLSQEVKEDELRRILSRYFRDKYHSINQFLDYLENNNE